MKTIHYQILRYLPDRVSGEFVNLGIVAYDYSGKLLKSKFINKIGKISNFFPAVNSRYLIKSIQTIKGDLELLSTRFHSEFAFDKIESLDSITKSILPKDDSSLVFSETKKCLDIEVGATVDDLFSRFINLHLNVEDDEVRKDKEVWQKVYKIHFDNYGISAHLNHHIVRTQNDELEFDKAWKNGVWNCFETVSFNLTRSDTIKNKVYKWVGKLEELNSSKEDLHIYLLSVLPNEHDELSKFITKKIKAKSTAKTKIDIVSEDQIETVMKRIKKEIEAHSK